MTFVWRYPTSVSTVPASALPVSRRISDRTRLTIARKVCVDVKPHGHLRMPGAPALLTIVDLQRQTQRRYSTRATVTAHLLALAQLHLRLTPSAVSAQPYVVTIVGRTLDEVTLRSHGIYTAEITRSYLDALAQQDTLAQPGVTVLERVFRTVEVAEERREFFEFMMQLLRGVEEVGGEEKAAVLVREALIPRVFNGELGKRARPLDLAPWWTQDDGWKRRRVHADGRDQRSGL